MDEAVFKAMAQLVSYFVDDLEQVIEHPSWVYPLKDIVDNYLYPE